jgi:transglutaminase-like putative cysteine protease
MTAATTTSRRALGGRHQLGLVAATATLLAAAPLMSLYENWTWLFRSLFAVAAIAAVAAAARALRAPVWAQTLAMLGALLLNLTWQFRSGDEWFLLPSPATFEHFGVLLGEVPNAIASEAIPVRDYDGLLLLTTLGVGLVAIVVDVVAVGLRRPAVAGLPMLAIYSVPVAVHAGSVPAYTFVIGAFGFLWLVGADNLDRVRRFGRRFTGDGRDVDLWEPSPLAAAGRRLTVIGALIAVMLPVAVPGMTTGLIDRFGSGLPGAGGTGGGSPTSVNLFAALDGLLNRDVTEELVRLTTNDPDPYYLRIGVAEEITERGFNHRSPRGGSVGDPLPPPPVRGGPGVTQLRHQAKVDILRWSMNRAPTFSDLTAISGLGNQWRYDQDQQVVFAADDRVSGSYEFDYTRSEFDPDMLRRAAPLPEDHPIQEALTEVLPVPQITDLVSDLTEGQTTPYDQVLAIRNYFSRANGFRYSLETGSETTGTAIVDFAIDNKAGYCVQYATAMAWLVREAGIPARVAIGFTTGSRRTGDTYVLTNHNLHAWTEVYFEGAGWVPFDPTPSSAIVGAVDREWSPNPDRPNPGDPTNPGGGPDSGSQLPGEEGTNDPDSGLPPDEIGAGGGGFGSGRSSWPLWVASAVALLLAMLIMPALRRAQLRRQRVPRRPAEVAAVPAGESAPGAVISGDPAAAARHRAHAAWDELLDTMIDFEVPLDPAETPRVTSHRLVRECRLDAERRSIAGDGARLLGHAEERAAYAVDPLSPAGLGSALRAVRQALAGQAGRRTRLRAVLLPPSTLQRWRTAVGDTTNRAVSAMNRVGDAVGRLSPRRILAQRSGS